MPSWTSRLDTGVDNAVRSYSKLQNENRAALLPVDLTVLAQGLGNVDIDDREMIPEAAVQVSGSRFQIYLQSTFKDRPGMRVRRRFSLAHEISHTFFFESRDGAIRPMRGGPRGMDLEAACHEGASRLLVPEPFLRKELPERYDIAGEDVLRLADKFDVSGEVLLRRLRNELVFDTVDLCFALCRLGKIEYAMYPPWLGRFLGKPSRTSLQHWFHTADVSLDGWFRASGLEVEKLPNGSVFGKNAEGILAARRLRAGPSRELFEIRLCAAESSCEELLSRTLGGDDAARIQQTCTPTLLESVQRDLDPQG